VLADVAQAGRPQQRVGHGMRDDIGVAVTHQPTLGLERHATEHQ
jgi:hypothetical protein